MSGAPDQTLWCMRTIGPDEVFAYASKGAAEVAVEQFHAAVERIYARNGETPPEPKPWAVVEPWPWSAENHALALKEYKE